jgi:hypothetical protein
MILMVVWMTLMEGRSRHLVLDLEAARIEWWTVQWIEQKVGARASTFV